MSKYSVDLGSRDVEPRVFSTNNVFIGVLESVVVIRHAILIEYGVVFGSMS